MDVWRRAADEMNKLGEGTRKAGIHLGFHNHGFEFKVDGVLIFDELMSRLDKGLVKSQFQLSNAFSLGFDPAVYLTKYPDRFLSLHLQDWLASGEGGCRWDRARSTGGRSSLPQRTAASSITLSRCAWTP